LTFRAHFWTISVYTHGDNLGRDFRTRREAVRYVRWVLANANPRGIRVDHVRPHPDGDYCRYWEWWGGEVCLQRWRSRLLGSWQHAETWLPLSVLETL